MNRFDHVWARLIALARPGAAEEVCVAPPGFATRVAALAVAGRVRVGSIWEGLAVRSFGIACLVTLLAVASLWPLVGDAAHAELVELADPLVVADLSP